MKKSIEKFESKKVKNLSAIKGGNKNSDWNDDDTKQVKFRRVTFQLK